VRAVLVFFFVSRTLAWRRTNLRRICFPRTPQRDGNSIDCLYHAIRRGRSRRTRPNIGAGRQDVVRQTDQTDAHAVPATALASSTSRLPAGQALRPCLPPPWSPQPLAGQALRPCPPASWPPRRGQAASPHGGRMCSERLRGQIYGA
jgi:hypothetical protein